MGKEHFKAQKRAEKCPRIASLNVGAILLSSMTSLYIQFWLWTGQGWLAQNRTVVLRRPKYSQGMDVTASNHDQPKREITRFPVRRSLVRKSHRNGLKIARLPAQICLSRCCIMRIANGEDTRFENRSLATATTRQKPHSVGVGGNYCLYANQHCARVHCVRFHRKPLTLT